MRRGAKPAKAKVEAKPPIVRKSRKSEGARVHDLEKRLAEALEQQTATSEILRVIAASPTDLQPVFDTIARNAAQLCEARALVFRFDGQLLHFVAHYGLTAEGAEAVRRAWPMAPAPGTAAGRSILTPGIAHIPDVHEDPGYKYGTVAEVATFRSIVAVSMMRHGVPIGTITVNRSQAGLFPNRQIDLLKTFADQAVIAIENVRLFSETKEALERQTASSEILRVISSSPTDAQPVFEAIARNAARLCDASRSSVNLLEGDWIRFVARCNFPEGWTQIHVADAPNATRVIRDGVIFHVADAETDARVTPEALSRVRALGARSFLMVPLRRETIPIGSIVVYRSETGNFSDQQVELLKTFADQAVIAIENVRLFNETKEALERQTATSEILRVISSSPTDIQPVLETIVEHAGRVCGAFDAIVYLVEGDQLVRAAHRGPVPIVEESLSVPIARDSASGAAVLDCRTVYVEDILASQEFPRGRAFAERSGFRTAVSVPLVKEGAAIGTLVVRRTEVQAFTAEQIALLETFADQAVIAIENVRLFTELQASNRELRTALDTQTATSEILRVISSSPTDVQPVFAAIAESAARLCGASDAIIDLREGDVLRRVAHHGQISALLPGATRLIARDSVVGRCVADGRPVHVHDLQAETGEFPVGAELARGTGHRTTLVVPLLREGVPLGSIGIRRLEVRPFTDAQIALLQTFAAQAVIAIENVRLFTELQARTEQLTRSVGQLTALSDVGRALSSTLDLDTVLQTIVTRASQLAGTDACSVFEYDEATEAFHLRATHNLDEEVVALARRTPMRKGEGVQGRMAVTRQHRAGGS